MKQTEKITIACFGECGRSVTLRRSKVRKADYYLCNSNVEGRLCEAKLPLLAHGKVRCINMNAAGSFWGYTDRPMSEEDAAFMARARAILAAAIAKK